MYERCLNEAERILATHKDVVVPVKEIWLEVTRQGQLQGFDIPSLADFTTLLEGDERFEFIPSSDEEYESYTEDEAAYVAEMEHLGFFPEDRVRLRGIEIIGGGIEEVSEFTEEAEERGEPAARRIQAGGRTAPQRPASATRLKPRTTPQRGRQAKKKNGKKKVFHSSTVKNQPKKKSKRRK